MCLHCIRKLDMRKGQRRNEENMELKEKKTRKYLIVAGAAYVLLILLSLHMGHYIYMQGFSTLQTGTGAIVFGGNTVNPAVTTNAVDWFGSFLYALNAMANTPFAFIPTTWLCIIPMFVFLLADAFFFMLACAMAEVREQSAPGKEHGSSKWNRNYKQYAGRYMAPYNPKTSPYDNNMIFSKNVGLNLDNKGTQLNANCLVVGGSGTGKSFRIIKPNLAQMNCSTITTDPSGELLKCCGKMLMDHGIRLKLFSTSDMEHSNCYNPFDYVFDENGIVDEAKVSTMVFLFLKNADNAKQKSGDPFWEKSAKALLSAIAYYLLEGHEIGTIEKESVNFNNMLRLIQSGKINEQSETSQSALDCLMEEHKRTMELENRESKALSNYDTFKLAPGKTANSILISCAVDLQLFNNENVKNLTRHDYEDEENNVHLDQVGDVQTALFINIPQANGTFNFLVSLLYSQLFDALYTKAERICPKKYMVVDQYKRPVVTMLNSMEEAEKTLELLKGATVQEYKTKRGALRYRIMNGKKAIAERPSLNSAQEIVQKAAEYSVSKGDLRLPWHVRCLMDEFANIGEVPEFSQKLSTMRKYEISCTIVIQNIAQIKERYDKLYESIIGGCDTVIYLGSSENETNKYISELLGDATIRARSISKSRKSGGSESFSSSKRQLMTPSELRTMRNTRCIVFIRGQDPFLDYKYNFCKHPHFKETGNGNKEKEITDEFLEIYFNSRPYKPQRKRGKTAQQKAVALNAGKSKYMQGKDSLKDALTDAGVKEGEEAEKISIPQSTPRNKKNKELYIIGEEPAAQKKETEQDSAPEGNQETLSDNIFMF